jgi:hypothetical protein
LQTPKHCKAHKTRHGEHKKVKKKILFNSHVSKPVSDVFQRTGDENASNKLQIKQL